MATIKSVTGMENKGSYALVHVVLEDGEEATVYIGGSVELFFDHKFNRIKAFIKKLKDA